LSRVLQGVMVMHLRRLRGVRALSAAWEGWRGPSASLGPLSRSWASSAASGVPPVCLPVVASVHRFS
jgi:hypothetical protein